PPSGKAKRRNPGHCPQPGAWQADLARVVVPRSIASAEQAAASNDAGSLPETTSTRADPGTRVLRRSGQQLSIELSVSVFNLWNETSGGTAVTLLVVRFC